MPWLPVLHTPDGVRGFFGDACIPRQEVWVAELEGRVAGFAALADGFLNHLYVHPANQGKGVGSALWQRATETYPAGFRFWVFQRNERARRFYEQRGAAVVELTDGAGNEEREADALYEWRP
ncbi:MAG: GNAT family N-acetyltransferase [Thermoleophilia bacterium]|nr:GNAT family N-acetyltransferase [Thermoleophilia bacterium]